MQADQTFTPTVVGEISTSSDQLSCVDKKNDTFQSWSTGDVFAPMQLRAMFNLVSRLEKVLSH
jgi:hypothetical protein